MGPGRPPPDRAAPASPWSSSPSAPASGPSAGWPAPSRAPPKGRVEPTLALDDVGLLLAAACLLIAVLLLVEGPTRRLTQLRALIEGLMIGGCSLFVAWNGVFGATFAIAEGASAIARTV